MDYFSLQTEKYESFESQNQKWTDGQKRFIDFYFDSKERNIRILDIGCGEGVGLAYLKSLGFKNVFGVEFNPRKAQIARKTATVYEQDAHNLDIPGKFDVVVLSHFLEHTLQPDVVLKNVAKLLKKTSEMLIVLPFPDTGPDDAHTAKYILGTAEGDEEKLDDYITKCGFTNLFSVRDGFREPEIWLYYALSKRV